jgi:cytochrome P450
VVIVSVTNEPVTFPGAREPTCPFDPPAPPIPPGKTNGRVRIWDGTEAWLITNYADSKAVLRDQRFSADPNNPGFPEKSAAYKASMAERNVRTLDNPDHDIEKRMLIRDFTVRRVSQLRPKIQEKVDGLVDAMLAQGPPADIVTDLAFPVPTMVICEMLGVPYEDRDFFGARANACLNSQVSADVASKAGAELEEYLDELIDKKDADPQDDLMSRLVVDVMRTGQRPRQHVIAQAKLVLVTGHETTANMIALSVLAMLSHPDQLELLTAHQDDPSMVANAVEELLRYISVAHTGRRRVALEDVDVNGTLIRKGDGVIVANNVADRDESIFPQSDTLDLTRQNARSTLAFGYGIHQCMGQLLSRVELQVVLSTLWRRMPTLRLSVPFEEVPFKEDGSVYGLFSLPVSWDR